MKRKVIQRSAGLSEKSDCETTIVVSKLDLQMRADVQEFLRKLKKDGEQAREVKIAVRKILHGVEDAHERAGKSKLHLGCLCIKPHIVSPIFYFYIKV